MSPETIAQIILESLRLANTLAANIPPEQHKAFWEQHMKNIEFWRGVLEKIGGFFQPVITPKPAPVASIQPAIAAADTP